MSGASHIIRVVTSSINTDIETFGSEMKTVNGIEPGRLLWRGAWNSELYGPLKPLHAEGARQGTDHLFHKSK